MTDYGHPITFGLSGYEAAPNVVGAIDPASARWGFVGDLATWVDALAIWSVEVGLDPFISWPTTSRIAELEVFAGEVVPAMRTRVGERRPKADRLAGVTRG